MTECRALSEDALVAVAARMLRDGAPVGFVLGYLARWARAT